MNGRIALLTALGLAVLVGNHAASAKGVANVMTAKSIPEATVAIIDPETGTSTGGAGDVRLAAGDIILFKFKYYPAPVGNLHGLVGYLTEYVPPNTEVVGVRIMDEDGVTIPPNAPGIAYDKCGGACKGFTLPCSTGTCTYDDGTIAQLVADTGLFYATDPRTGRWPDTDYLSLQNGYPVTGLEFADNIAPEIGASAPFNAHNLWDKVQATAYGQDAGYTPWRFGSPVAGPDTYYLYEATDVGGVIRWNQTTGPWNRIVYPGSTVGKGPAEGAGATANTPSRVTATDDFVFPGANTWDVTPNTPLPWADPFGAGTRTRAVRYSLGESRVGEPGYVEIALRVKDVPLDPFQDANVDCGEIIGGDVSALAGGNDNPWGYFIPSPACVNLTLLFDLTVDQPLQRTLNITYTVHGKNLSLSPQNNVYVRLRYDIPTYVSATTIAGVTMVNLPTCDDGSGAKCVRWGPMTLAPSDEYTFNATFSNTQVASNLAAFANYSSTTYPLNLTTGVGGYTVSSLTVPAETSMPDSDLAVTTPSATPGSTAQVSGTLANVGTGTATYRTVGLVLPTGWSLAGNAVTIAGTSYACTTAAPFAPNRPSCTYNQAIDAGVSRTVSFALNVPAGTATGLYPFDWYIWSVDAGNGGEAETNFDSIAVVPVGAPRSGTPTMNCPIYADPPFISGTAPGAPVDSTVRLYFNGIQRATGLTAADGSWSIPASAWAAFADAPGELFVGLEIRATVDYPGTTGLESVKTAACFVAGGSACADTVDNDGDGLIDFPADPGCDSPNDRDEADLQCADGLDNDGDASTDWPADSGCYSEYDPIEGAPQCGDAIDDDGDGLNGFAGGDPDCASADDPTEFPVTACQDGLDNDGDGVTDFPADPACHAATDTSEVATCQDGLDNDGDGLADAADLGCLSYNDETEEDNPAVKPRLLVVFDTSGSMNWNTCEETFTGGDGSLECPGHDVDCADCGASDTCDDAMANDSRIYKVKEGITEAITAFGEVEYGLMRFHQGPVAFACPGQNAGFPSGGWQGAGLTPCPGFAYGDLLVGFSHDNSETMLSWMDGSSSFAGTADPPAGHDVELRGSGATPLAGSLTSARTYLQGIRVTDQELCRPYSVILVTDGGETCGGDPVDAATQIAALGVKVYVIGFATPDPAVIANLNAIATAGGTYPAIFADDSTELSMAMASIITDSIKYELCNGLDDDCDLLVDEDFADIGDPCDNGETGVCYEEGVRRCVPIGMPGAELGTYCDAPPGTPGTEICNNVDDDCDNLIDEGLDCTGCPDEVCNGFDDDCDCTADTNGDCPGDTNGDGTVCGLGDDGVCTCNASLPEGTPPCDDNVDEGNPGGGIDCGIETGECAFGATVCWAGAIECQGGVGPADEVCDGLDNDCDGVADGFSRECYGWPAGEFTHGCDYAYDEVTAAWVWTCIPTCQTGVQLCSPVAGPPVSGAWGACLGDYGPQTEICNLLDDDCDGEVDEGVEICNNLDDDCDGEIDEVDPTEPPLFPGYGDECGDGPTLGICRHGTLQCVGGAATCVGEILPATEVCNTIDEDCDGTADNNLPPPFGTACGTDVGVCELGHLECVDGLPDCVDDVEGTTEVCDCQDNDCDGTTDESDPALGDVCDGGVTTTDAGECRFGVLMCPGAPACALTCDGALGPTPERCNGLDDDCDNEVDEDFPTLGDTCERGTGACHRIGFVVCLPDGTAGCNAPEVLPGTEICNGVDDDCDLEIDEPDLPMVGTTCAPAVNNCPPGLWQCVDGELVCSSTVIPEEICNGIDDNCNGAVDEPPVPGTGADCPPEGMTLDEITGECKAGTIECLGGELVCDGAQGPTGELCNGLDDDCDGTPDDQAECPHPDEICWEGECILPCCYGQPPGCEFPCAGGLACVPVPDQGEYCVDDPCTGPGAVTCPGDEFCDKLTGECVAYCDVVTCREGLTCVGDGDCVDCFDPRLACEEGQICERDPAVNAGTCVTDPCPPGHCDVDEICIDGVCIGDCTDECDPGLYCDLPTGECKEDPCFDVECREDQVCNPLTQQCAPSLCEGRNCGPGQMCVPQTGLCEASPCDGVDCAEGYHCTVNFVGDPTCAPNVPPAIVEKIVATGGGGCGCTVAAREDEADGGAGGGAAVAGGLLLAGLLAVRRRRRRAPAGLGVVVLAAATALAAPGCKLDPWDLVHERDGGDEERPDAREVDAEPQLPDAAPPDACVVHEEVCDGVDNDCDDEVDEDTNFQADPNHCGDCATVCAYPNAEGLCVEGECQQGDCRPGYHDRDPTVPGCDYYCIVTSADEICNGLDDNCVDGIDEGIDKQTDESNCGICGRVCDLPNVDSVECQAGVCVIVNPPDGCAPGYFDADGLDYTGCEYFCTPTNGGVEICDGLDNDCDYLTDEGIDWVGAPCGVTDTPPCRLGSYQCLGGSQVCVGPILPRDETCNGVDDDCDTFVDNLPSLATDVNNCGACGNRCAFPNAGATCAGGECVQQACNVNFHDTDPLVPGCDYYCVVTSPVEFCDGLDNDCDGTPDNDVDTTSDVDNCGACGHACAFLNAAASCVGGECQVGDCAPGYWDRDPAPGCEYACVLTNEGIEICDGVDNDCDRLVDNADPTMEPTALACDADGACAGTTPVCGSTPCDPVVRWRCTYAPPAEVDGCGNLLADEAICDGLDGDCDTEVDEHVDKLSDPRNCGGCGQICNLPNAIEGCTAGVCTVASCNAGWVDRTTPAPPLPDDGCEYFCTITGGEVCDGKDNDCDELVDTDDPDLLDPPNFCRNTPDSPCESVVPVCATAPAGCPGATTKTWRCLYTGLPGAEVNACGNLAVDEALCDEIDGDCDGIPDDSFGAKGAECADEEIGACQSRGEYVCTGDGLGLECLITEAGAMPSRELCDGVDQDCDGELDDRNGVPGPEYDLIEDMIPVTVGLATVWVFRHEAVRPDADASNPGYEEHRACARGGAVPWTNVSWTEASAACAAAGLRLCDESEWQRACGTADGWAYPYGDAYERFTCNGDDYDPNGVPPDNDVLLATGAMAMCVSPEGFHDMSGNAKEWTRTNVGTELDPAYRIKGGAYDSLKGGLSCEHAFIAASPSYYYGNLGFRCCSSTDPALTPTPPPLP